MYLKHQLKTLLYVRYLAKVLFYSVSRLGAVQKQ